MYLDKVFIKHQIICIVPKKEFVKKFVFSNFPAKSYWKSKNNCKILLKESGCGLESRCCHVNFRYGACFEQGVP